MKSAYDNNEHYSQNNQAQIYVDNLPNTMTKESLKKLFEPYGNLSYLKFLKHRTDGQTGYGFVSFSDYSDSYYAIKKINGKVIDNHCIRASYARPESQVLSNKNLYVCGLPLMFKSEQLKELFNLYGDISETRVLSNTILTESKGVGFVHFVNPSDAKKAIQAMNGTTPEGMNSPLIVKFARDVRKTPKSRQTGDESTSSGENDFFPPVGTVVCKYFQSGKCNRGEDCNYSHVTEDQTMASNSKLIRSYNTWGLLNSASGAAPVLPEWDTDLLDGKVDYQDIKEFDEFDARKRDLELKMCGLPSAESQLLFPTKLDFDFSNFCAATMLELDKGTKPLPNKPSIGDSEAIIEIVTRQVEKLRLNGALTSKSDSSNKTKQSIGSIEPGNAMPINSANALEMAENGKLKASIDERLVHSNDEKETLKPSLSISNGQCAMIEETKEKEPIAKNRESIKGLGKIVYQALLASRQNSANTINTSAFKPVGAPTEPSKGNLLNQHETSNGQSLQLGQISQMEQPINLEQPTSIGQMHLQQPFTQSFGQAFDAVGVQNNSMTSTTSTPLPIDSFGIPITSSQNSGLNGLNGLNSQFESSQVQKQCLDNFPVNGFNPKVLKNPKGTLDKSAQSFPNLHLQLGGEQYNFARASASTSASGSSSLGKCESSHSDYSSGISKTNLYVSQFPREWSNKDLEDLFSCFGDIEKIRILTPENADKNRGVGFVHFRDSSSASNAISTMQNYIPENCFKPIIVKFANQGSKSSRSSHSLPGTCKFWLKGDCTRKSQCSFKHETSECIQYDGNPFCAGPSVSSIGGVPLGHAAHGTLGVVGGIGTIGAHEPQAQYQSNGTSSQALVGSFGKQTVESELKSLSDDESSKQKKASIRLEKLSPVEVFSEFSTAPAVERNGKLSKIELCVRHPTGDMNKRSAKKAAGSKSDDEKNKKPNGAVSLISPRKDGPSKTIADVASNNKEENPQASNQAVLSSTTLNTNAEIQSNNLNGLRNLGSLIYSMGTGSSPKSIFPDRWLDTLPPVSSPTTKRNNTKRQKGQQPVTEYMDLSSEIAQKKKQEAKDRLKSRLASSMAGGWAQIPAGGLLTFNKEIPPHQTAEAAQNASDCNGNQPMPADGKGLLKEWPLLTNGSLNAGANNGVVNGTNAQETLVKAMALSEETLSGSLEKNVEEELRLLSSLERPVCSRSQERSLVRMSDEEERKLDQYLLENFMKSLGCKSLNKHFENILKDFVF